jgi:ABC-type nitrate/sulfonate/bicarbonate transport system permease component
MSVNQTQTLGSGSRAPGMWVLLLNSPITIKIMAGIVILALWEGVVRFAAPPYVAKPSGIIEAFPSVVVNPEFLSATAITLEAVAVGLVVAIVLGTILGLVIGRVKAVDYSLSRYVNILFTMPMIAILPLLSLWFGHTSATRFVLIVLVAGITIVISVSDGARDVPARYLEVSKSFRAGRMRTMFGVVLPASIPYLLAGIRLAAGRALTSAVIADFFLAIPGLGYYILYNSRSFHHNEAFVGVIALAAAGVGFDGFINWIIHKKLRWLRRDSNPSYS